MKNQRYIPRNLSFIEHLGNRSEFFPILGIMYNVFHSAEVYLASVGTNMKGKDIPANPVKINAKSIQFSVFSIQCSGHFRCCKFIGFHESGRASIENGRVKLSFE